MAAYFTKSRSYLWLVCWMLGTVIPMAAQQTPEETEQEYQLLETDEERYNLLLQASNHLAQKYPQEALDFSQRAFNIARKLGNRLAGAKALVQEGRIRQKLGEYQAAIKPLGQAIAAIQNSDRKNRSYYKKMADVSTQIGISYEQLKNYKRAQSYYQKALENALESKSTPDVADAYNNLGEIYAARGRLRQAIESFNNAAPYAQRANLPRLTVQIDKNLKLAKEAYKQTVDAQKYAADIEEFEETISIVKDSLTTIEASRQVLMSENEVLELETQAQQEELARREAEVRAIEAEKKLVEEEQARLAERNLIGIVGGIFLISIFSLFTINQVQQNRIIKKAKKQADDLLRNILPDEIAEELKNSQMVKPRSKQEVTILFTDFKGFTSLARDMEPEELLEELNYAFRHFDTIIEKYGLEKIKTIGDAYMAAAGLVHPDPFHALNAVKAATEMQHFMHQWNIIHRQQNKPEWKLRIGIYSGKVVAGVICTKKFAYDIWGDDVNVASRMESNGEPGKVNLSEATYELIRPYVEVEAPRREEIKNRGEMNMYFLSRILPEAAQPSVSPRSETPAQTT